MENSVCEAKRILSITKKLTGPIAFTSWIENVKYESPLIYSGNLQVELPENNE
jgi:hypothetical protein